MYWSKLFWPITMLGALAWLIWGDWTLSQDGEAVAFCTLLLLVTIVRILLWIFQPESYEVIKPGEYPSRIDEWQYLHTIDAQPLPSKRRQETKSA